MKNYFKLFPDQDCVAAVIGVSVCFFVFALTSLSLLKDCWDGEDIDLCRLAEVAFMALTLVFALHSEHLPELRGNPTPLNR